MDSKELDLVRDDLFMHNLNSTLSVKRDYELNEYDYEWLDKIEETLPYLDNILRNPKRFIINEEEIVKIEQAKKDAAARNAAQKKAIEEQKEPKNYISKENAQISDEGELTNIIVGILDASPEQIEQYKAGKNNLFDYFVGQVMKNTRGKANPVLTKELLHEELDKR